MTRLVAVVAIIAAGCWTSPRASRPRPRDGASEVLVRRAPGASELAVDATHVYWIGDAGVWRAEKRASAAPERLATLEEEGFALVIDDTHVFWGDHARVMMAPKAGGTAVELATANAEHVVWSLARHRDELVVAAYDDGAERTTILRIVVPARKERAVVRIDGARPTLVPWRSLLYVATDRQLVAIDEHGFARELVARPRGITALAVGKRHLYFASAAKLERIARGAEGAAAPFVASGGEVYSIAVDEKYLYWTAFSSTDPRANAIYRIAKQGGWRERLVDGSGEIGGVVIDGDHLYWSDATRGRILRRRR